MALFIGKNGKYYLITSTSILIIFLFFITIQKNNKLNSVDVFATNEILIFNNNNPINIKGKWRGLTKDQIGNMSILGRMLFLEEPPPSSIKNKQKIYKIAIWKYGKFIENRHLKQFTSQYIDPLSECQVKNCKIYNENRTIKKADIVIFHLHRMKGIADLPKINQRQPKQIWAFLTDESPQNTFLYNKLNNLTIYNNLFNWSMMYRMDADIPVPYGRIVLRKKPIDSFFIGEKRRDVLIAIMGSNCDSRNKRWEYVREIQKYTKVHIYGKCGPFKCFGHFRKDCPLLNSYLFYLAFENSNCIEYVTEKLWWNAIQKNSIPIVMGANKDTYIKILPPNSYLNVEDYANPQALVNHVLYLNKTGEYHKYYLWKQYFEVKNEHGYFQSKSVHYCRICEALNFNNRKPKIYKNLQQFLYNSKMCFPSWKKI